MMRHRFFPLFCLFLVAGAFAQQPVSSPRFDAVDAIVRQAIDEHQVPGAVVVVGHDGQVVYRKAFGHRSLEPTVEPMTLDTIFDMASLTKSMATAMSVMRLLELGQVRLNDPVAKYVPEFGKNGKEEITVRQLLTHYSGLRPDLALDTPWRGYDEALRRVYDEKPILPPGARFLYSDINFIVLGEMVARVAKVPLNQYAEAHIFAPLKMEHTRFLPPQEWLPMIAPTQYEGAELSTPVGRAVSGVKGEGAMLRGVVHDPTSRRMGGVAGHAGLFSRADDVAKFAQALLDRNGTVLSPLIIEKMTTPQQPPNATSLRGLGWDIDTSFSSNRGDLLPVGSFGHTGFTGTSLWIDPTTNSYIIILTNAVHPRGGSAVALRARVGTAVAAALELTPSEKEKVRVAEITGYNDLLPGMRRVQSRNGSVLNGIDVLEAADFKQLRDEDPSKVRKIGVLTNQNGLDRQGRRTIDVLAHAAGIKLTVIFSPEHGVTGTLDTSAIGNTVDQATGVSVYSIYGDTDAKRRPPLDVMRQLDAVVIDVWDVGARYWTYTTATGYFLEAAAKTGTEIVVLDRPNPVSGAIVQGPVSDGGNTAPGGSCEGAAGCPYIDYFPEPTRHGMTLGELAGMFNGERKLGAKLTLVPMQGWQRGDWFDSTSLMWTNPSPNMRNLTEAALYTGVAEVEGTNVSVGRGTDTPFEVLGAPWIKAGELSEYLNARLISGVRFVPVTFTPATGSKFGGQLCGGVNIVLLDRYTLDAPELGVELASALQKLYPQDFKIGNMVYLLGNRKAFDAIVAGQDPRRVADDWRDELEGFIQMRQKYLIYK